jgi:DNA-binding MarR family transcriptional regulator
MTDTPPWHETLVFSALLRHARNTYGGAMRAALAEIGCDDVPRNGLWVIGGLSLGAPAVPLGDLIRDLRVSKQAAGQLVDTLVLRGYLERSADPQDRRKLTVTLTERGKAVAAAQTKARERIDAQLLERVGEEHVRHARATLAALIEIGQAGEETGED